MVRNEDIKQEFDLFAAIWKMFKSLLPVSSKDDEAYWDSVTGQIKEIMNTYPGQLATDLSMAVLSELERRCRTNENTNSGRKPVS